MSPYSRTLERLVAEFERFAHAPAIDQEAAQLRMLSRLVDSAWRLSPFWRARLDASGWSPGKAFDRAALERLPVLTRAEVQASREAMQSRPLDPRWGAVRSMATSGSTGQPVTIDRVALQAAQYDAMTVANHAWHRRDVSLKLGVIRNSVKADFHRDDWGQPMAGLHRTGPAAGLRGEGGDIGRELDWLEAEKPDYLLTQPGRALGLARMALERGGARHRLREVISFGETVTAEARAAVREAFGAEMKDIYSAKDTGYLALQCPHCSAGHEHYHVLSHLVMVELVDERGRAVPQGEPGDVLVTILHSFAMPMLRYQVGDIALAGACDSAIRLPVLERIVGRHRHLARTPEGRLRHVQFPGWRFAKIAPLTEYRLVQRGANQVEALLVCPRPLGAAEEQAFAALIRECFGWPIEVRIRQVEAIDGGPEGKREEFVRIE